MIIANLATYPPRRSQLRYVAEALAPQVDRLNIVLNEYASELPELSNIENVVQVIPAEDTKDAGKFYPDVRMAKYVLLVDDDMIYPNDYTSHTIKEFESLGDSGFVGGYHGSLYLMPRLSLRPKSLRKWLAYRPEHIAKYRKVHLYRRSLNRPVVVDQIATNAAVLRGSEMPPYEYMRDSQKFVDVRLAKWCFENNIRPVALPRRKGWLSGIEFEETIYGGFTCLDPPHVADEIWSYAFKVRDRGKKIKRKK